MRASDLRREEMVGVDTGKGFPLFGSYRIIKMGLEPFGVFIDNLRQILGNEEAAMILTRFGYETGMGMAMYISEMYDFDSQEEWLKSSCLLHNIGGFVNQEFQGIELDEQNKSMRFSGVWYDSFEATIWRSQHTEFSYKPVCRIMTGMASGFASAVLGKEVIVKETSCFAQGGEKHCLFEGRSVDQWGEGSREVRDHIAFSNLEDDLRRFRAGIKQSFEQLVRQSAEIKLIKRQTAQPNIKHGMIFRSKSMADLLVMAEKVAPTNATVLIQGESGTGKEVIARYVHRHSACKDKSFLAVSCAALPPNLLETELFGHVKGAFTGADTDKKGLLEEVGNGTFFLDEVAELPLDLQAKLLRALQEKEVRPVGSVKHIPINARIIASTNKDLKKMVSDGLFREDLYYRLAVFPILITPLRERRQDILLLARHFLASLRENHPGFSPDALRRMESYAWPGNVRELENCVEYAGVLAGNDRIMTEHLPDSVQKNSHDLLSGLAMDMPTQKELERRYTKLVLTHTENNKAEAARILGVGVTTLWRRLKDNTV